MNVHPTAPARLAVALCMMLDALVLALLTVILFILLTGGGVVEVAEIRIRARTAANPLLFLAVAVALRYAARGWSPFLGMRRLPIARLVSAGVHVSCDTFPARLTRLFHRPAVALIAIGITVLLVKLLLAWRLPGFFSGDDVEIHEMSMGALFDRDWPVWTLRNAFFPMLFIFPAQHIVVVLGGVTPEALVLAGRAVVAVLSTAAIPLTWLAARRLVPADPSVAALATALFALNKLHISFGSSELPRPVSTAFVAGAFLCTLRERPIWSTVAGILLGIAAVFRFSEVVFVPAALLTLMRGGHWRDALILLVAAVLTFGGITAVADAMYWGQPFSSVAAAIDYTLVQRESSRGYEPPWEYLKIIPAWSTFLFVGLAVLGSSRTRPESWWLWTPFALLSLLPHKESRYLIPVIPFFAIAASRGFLRAIGWIRQSAGAPRWKLWARELFAPALLLSVLHDVSGWRLLRSNEGIRLARYVRPSGSDGIAAQDVWRLGGRAYLWRHEPLVELPAVLVTDGGALARAVADVRWVALRSRTARTVGDPALSSLGFRRDDAWRGEDYVLYVRAVPRFGGQGS
jgi:hypothetical protein